MQGRRLAVLMWKHLTVRMRRFIHTPIEILSPIVFFIILFSLKDEVKPIPPSAVRIGENVIKNTDVLQLKDLPAPSRVLYTPDTELTRDLMDAVGAQLGLKRLGRPPGRLEHRKGYYPFTNFTEISDIVTNMYEEDAIVIFDNMKDRDTWPEQPVLAYTIRMRNSFHTETYEAFDGTRKPHRQFGTIYQQFMRLQWAIDTSYIKTLTGTELTQALSIQEFPSFGRSSNDVMPLICSLLEIICWISLFLVFVFLMARLLEERSTGIQELIKMVGVSTNLFGISHFLNMLPAGLMYSIGGTLLLTTSSTPIIENSEPTIIFIMLALHYVSVIAMAFACSYIVQSTQYTVSLSVFAYLALWQPTRLASQVEVKGAAYLTGLLPHVPLNWCWAQIAAREQYGEGLTFSDILTSRSPDSGPVLLGALFLVIQAMFFFSLAWYLSLVRPGNYGQALPWNFLFQKQYWTKNEVNPHSDVDEEVPIAREAKYFEEPPKNLEVGIKVENVSKMFPKNKALTNVSLDVYKGEITVLLGHNGAGKTTLMSIITGMCSASEGRVLVDGADVRGGGAARASLGLCPQHNLFFPDLTVLEHAIFFHLLKGGSYKEARTSSLDLLSRLGLESKAGVHSGALSGGMKRRLQLACALAGGASVLVLDEPTSGLDVETRRELWDLLLSLRGERTVLLTTHFMEEADALGDRVAALHLGHLRCHATTMYLKKALGTGYRLTFTTNGAPRDAAVTAAVTSHVADATLKEKTINSLSYNLPANACGHFPALFTSLEERKSELGIETIGVGVSTLEEVFLKLCSDTHAPLSEDEIDSTRIEPTYNKVTGAKLYARQLWVLLKRQVKYLWFKKTSFFLLQALIPIAIICVVTKTTNNYAVQTVDTSSMSIDLNIYENMPAWRVLYHVASAGVSMQSVADRWPRVEFVSTDNDVAEEILAISKKDATEYNKYLAGIEINDTHVKALFTTTVRHAAPVALGLLSNALATRHLPSSGGGALRPRLQPVAPGSALTLHDKLETPKDLDNIMLWSFVVVFVILSTNINSVSLPCKERVSGARHIHLMSGCPASLHWLATAAFHTALCVILLVLTAAVAVAALDTDRTLATADFIWSLFLVLTLGALAFFAFMYIVSCYFEERGAGVILVAALVIFGLVTPIMKTATDLLKKEDPRWYDILLSLASYTMPPHSATVAVAKCAYTARLNAYCELNKERCPMLFIAEVGFDGDKCCAGEKPMCYMCFTDYAPGKEIIILTVQFIVYMTLVILTQRGLFNSLHDRIFNGSYRNSAQKDDCDDEIVRAEAVYVNKQIALPKEKIVESNHAMLVSDLHKNYFRLFGKSCAAVRGINFSVKKGECFGLLGVNGAGKSSTFKMLTAEECTTKGNIYANGHFRSETQPYLRSLGYCPQFFGLDEFLTGVENLTLLLTLRGLDAADVSREVNSWIEVVGLQKYAHRAVCGYSGGCARRLAAAAALACGAPLTLLDEPTAGVDAGARRRVWAALARGLRRGRALVITSHSMDEMEALCSRIAIMSAGRVRAAGTPSELRARHAAGHAVVIKVTQPQGDEVDSAKSDLERLKSSLHHKFNCTLKDEHKTMLHYHINETMRYSNLFSALEELKATYPSLVEDYSVTETTLEEVFLSFAREQRPPTEPEVRNHVV